MQAERKSLMSEMASVRTENLTLQGLLARCVCGAGGAHSRVLTPSDRLRGGGLASSGWKRREDQDLGWEVAGGEGSPYNGAGIDEGLGSDEDEGSEGSGWRYDGGIGEQRWCRVAILSPVPEDGMGSQTQSPVTHTQAPVPSEPPHRSVQKSFSLGQNLRLGASQFRPLVV